MPGVVVMGLASFFVLVAVVMSLATPRRDPHRWGQREDHEGTWAEIESDDIAQMIEARNDIRRRRGLPAIGDDLEAELQRDLAAREGRELR